MTSLRDTHPSSSYAPKVSYPVLDLSSFTVCASLHPANKKCIRESSFNMTRGGGDEDIEGGAPKIFRHPKGGL